MTAASLSLTRDELLAVLHIMGTQSMSGLKEEPFAGLSELEIEERLNSGYETLTNRGLIEETGPDELMFDDTVLALVGACVIPETTLLLSYARPDGTSDPHYFCTTPELLVEHSSLRPGVHRFTHLPSGDALLDRAQALLAGLPADRPAADGYGGTLADDGLATVLKRSRQHDAPAARPVLNDAGWPQAAAEALLEDCVDLDAFWTGIAAWGLRQAEPEGVESIMAIVGRRRAWLVTSRPGEPAQLDVRTADGLECRRALLGLLGHLQAAPART
jgi:hypothetical protein